MWCGKDSGFTKSKLRYRSFRFPEDPSTIQSPFAKPKCTSHREGKFSSEANPVLTKIHHNNASAMERNASFSEAVLSKFHYIDLNITL